MVSLCTYLFVGDVSDRMQQLGGWNTELVLKLNQVAMETAH
jgi:hypothetical protein